MERRYRLTKRSEFMRVRQSGKTYAHPLLVLITKHNGLPISRFAFSAGRSVGTSIKRNRAKRLLRAAVQLKLNAIQTGWDMIIIARYSINSTKFHDIQVTLEQILQQAGLLRELNND